VTSCNLSNTQCCRPRAGRAQVRVSASHRFVRVTEQGADSVKGLSGLHQPAGESVAQGVKDHLAQGIRDPVIEAEGVNGPAEAVADLRGLLSVAIREDVISGRGIDATENFYDSIGHEGHSRLSLFAVEDLDGAGVHVQVEALEPEKFPASHAGVQRDIAQVAQGRGAAAEFIHQSCCFGHGQEPKALVVDVRHIELGHLAGPQSPILAFAHDAAELGQDVLDCLRPEVFCLQVLGQAIDVCGRDFVQAPSAQGWLYVVFEAAQVHGFGWSAGDIAFAVFLPCICDGHRREVCRQGVGVAQGSDAFAPDLRGQGGVDTIASPADLLPFLALTDFVCDVKACVRLAHEGAAFSVSLVYSDVLGLLPVTAHFSTLLLPCECKSMRFSALGTISTSTEITAGYSRKKHTRRASGQPPELKAASSILALRTREIKGLQKQPVSPFSFPHHIPHPKEPGQP